jgi:predicted nucleotidyltransferase
LSTLQERVIHKTREVWYTEAKGIIMPNNIEAIKAELDTLTKIIVETVPVEQVYLFGSYAYGTPHKDSDLELNRFLDRKTDATLERKIAREGVKLYG